MESKRRKKGENEEINHFFFPIDLFPYNPEDKLKKLKKEFLSFRKCKQLGLT